MNKWQCRYAPSLGALEGTPEEVWGTEPYLSEDKPTVFFGLYSLNDFFALRNHKGRKAILFAGSDITHFINGWWLDEEGRIRVEPERFAEWIQANCESYVENGVEAEALRVFGIESKIVPSFMGNVKDYEVCFTSNPRPQIYASVSGNDFALYGWEQIEMIADKVHADIHLYGNSVPWESKHSNVFVHGRIPKEQMNEEIRHMQSGLRVLEFDGASEILIKSILWCQWPISRIGYPYIDSFTTNEELIKLINALGQKTGPNLKGREYYLRNLNNYPWHA